MPRSISPGRVRRGALAVVLSGLALTTVSGCANLSEQATDLSYDPADGVSGSVGSLELRDIALISPGKGQSAALNGLVSNSAAVPVKLTMTATGGAPVTVSIPASNSVRLDGKPDGNSTATIAPATVKNLAAAPGENAQMTFTGSSAGAVTLSVPVLLNQPPYGDAKVTHAPAEGGSADH